MLKNIFEEYMEMENSRIENCFMGDYKNGWDVKRHCLYINGVVWGKYRERDPKTIDVIKSNISNECIKNIFQKYSENQLQSLKSCGKHDIITTKKIMNLEGQLEDLTKLSLEQWMRMYQPLTIEECLKNGDEDIECAIHLAFIEFSYELYRIECKSIYNKEQGKVKQLYSNNHDLLTFYEKYELIPIDNERKLLAINPPRIYDIEADKTLYIQNVSVELADKLNDLYSQKIIESLSFRVSNRGIYHGKNELEHLLEEVEFGKAFSFVDLGKIPLTKLYSKSYEDCLWVKIDLENMTFEELCEDFVTCDDKIVTQVIHLEYKKEDNKVYITHIDHEYIFYTLEEYEKRLKNSEQKGCASTRMKTFKVNNALIPFDLSYNVSWKDRDEEKLHVVEIPFLYFVLQCYFKHTDLLHEYFSNLFHS